MYSSSHTYNACDYVSVFGTAATYSNGVWTWDIPPEYFSNQRGTLCTVQIVSGSLCGSSGANCSALLWMSGAANANHVQSPIKTVDPFQFKISGADATAKMTNTPIIATTNESAGNSMNIEGGVEYLTPARPSQIRIGIVELVQGSDAGQISTPSDTKYSLALVFKFTYYDAVTSALELHNHQYTKTL